MLTTQQEAFADAVYRGENNLVLTANPGSGKSTTIAKAIERLPIYSGTLCVVKMNKTAIDTKKRVPAHVDVTNLNKLGWRMLKNAYSRIFKASDNKYRNLAYDFIKEEMPDLYQRQYKEKEARREVNEIAYSVAYLAKLLRMWLIDPKDQELVMSIAAQFGASQRPEVLDLMPRVLEKGISSLARGFHDFTDQIWAPLKLGMVPEDRYEYVFLDECQDMSVAEVAFSQLYTMPDGYMHAAGDRNQAVLAFTGIGVESHDMVLKRLNAKELPLTTTFRFGKNIAALVEHISPIVTENNGRPDGEVQYVSPADFLVAVRPGDAVVARWNRWILAAAFMTVEQGIPVCIAGQEDLGDEIIELIQQVSESEWWTGFDYLLSALWRYGASEENALRDAKADPARIDTFAMMLENAEAVIGSVKANDMDELINHIKAVFQASEEGAVSFLSTHKSKGGEWDRVWILQPEDYVKNPTEADMLMDWQQREERNIWFVAATRAREVVSLVPGWKEYCQANSAYEKARK